MLAIVTTTISVIIVLIVTGRMGLKSILPVTSFQFSLAQCQTWSVALTVTGTASERVKQTLVNTFFT